VLLFFRPERSAAAPSVSGPIAPLAAPPYIWPLPFVLNGTDPERERSETPPPTLCAPTRYDVMDDSGSELKGVSPSPPPASRAARLQTSMRTRKGRLCLILFPLALVIVAVALGVTFGLRAHRQAKQAQQTGPTSITITLAPTAPANASALDPALVSFSIEGDRWTDWAGIDGPNQFVINALGNLQNKTGAAPWVRVGADTEGELEHHVNKQ
jgi:hypothetical protein